MKARNLREHSPGFEPLISNREEDLYILVVWGLVFVQIDLLQGYGFIVLLHRWVGDRMSALFIVCFFFLYSSRYYHEPWASAYTSMSIQLITNQTKTDVHL